jgi:hypothetical protein
MRILLDSLTKIGVADRIQLGLLMAAVAGIALTFWQLRSNGRTQRGSFLKDLYLTLITDPLICEAYYLIEYNKFTYDSNFHGSPTEPKIDRLLSFADLVCELYFQGIIKRREMEFFTYRLLRLAKDPNIQAYLEFLTGFYKQVGTKKRPFHSFVSYGMSHGHVEL